MLVKRSLEHTQYLYFRCQVSSMAKFNSCISYNENGDCFVSTLSSTTFIFRSALYDQRLQVHRNIALLYNRSILMDGQLVLRSLVVITSVVYNSGYDYQTGWWYKDHFNPSGVQYGVEYFSYLAVFYLRHWMYFHPGQWK